MSLSDLDKDSRYRVIDLAEAVLEAFEGGDWPLALELWIDADMTNDERLECWSFFSDSRQRAWLKGDDRNYMKDENLWTK